MVNIKNVCPITFEEISVDKGVMVISYNRNRGDVDNAGNIIRGNITYYENEEIFNLAWQHAGRPCCPITRNTEYVSIELKSLTDKDLEELITSDGKLQEGALTPGLAEKSAIKKCFMHNRANANDDNNARASYNAARFFPNENNRNNADNETFLMAALRFADRVRHERMEEERHNRVRFRGYPYG